MTAIAACALLLFTAAGAPAPEPAGPGGSGALRSIAVLDVKAASPDDKATAALFTSALAQASAKASKARVIAPDELRALLDTAATQALLGCDDDPRCTVDKLKNVLTVDEIVVARIGRLNVDGKGGGLLAFVSLIDAKTASVIARSSTSITSASAADVSGGADGAAKTLWSEVAAQNGDRQLAELRMALLFDEAVSTSSATGASDRPSEKLRAVETCVQDQLVSAGVHMVAPDSVAVLKGEGADALQASLLAGGVPPFLTSWEVDALVVTRVEYTAGGAFAGAERVDADMSLRFVQVDTGTVVAAKQLRRSGNGFNASAARKDAAAKLCADVKPLLAAALDQRRARGSRVVVDVSAGASDPSTRGAPAPPAVPAVLDTDALVAELKKLKSVARVRVARFDERSATLDVVVSGGDGVSLALDVLAQSRAPAAATAATATGATRRLRVVSAEPSQLRLTR